MNHANLWLVHLIFNSVWGFRGKVWVAFTLVHRFNSCTRALKRNAAARKRSIMKTLPRMHFLEPNLIDWASRVLGLVAGAWKSVQRSGLQFRPRKRVKCVEVTHLWHSDILQFICLVSRRQPVVIILGKIDKFTDLIKCTECHVDRSRGFFSWCPKTACAPWKAKSSIALLALLRLHVLIFVNESTRASERSYYKRSKVILISPILMLNPSEWRQRGTSQTRGRFSRMRAMNFRFQKVMSHRIWPCLITAERHTITTCHAVDINYK